MKNQLAAGSFTKSIYFKVIVLLTMVSVLFLISIAAIYRYSNQYFQKEFTNSSAVLGDQISRNIESTLRTVEQRNFTSLTLSNTLGDSLDKVNKSGGIGLETGLLYNQLNNALDSCFASSKQVNWMSVVDLNNHICFTRNNISTPLDSASILRLTDKYGSDVRTNYGATVWIHGSDSIYFMRAVFKSDTLRFSGYFIAEVKSTVLDSVFSDLDFKKLGNFSVYDKEGESIYTTDNLSLTFLSLSDASRLNISSNDNGYTGVFYDIGYGGLTFLHYINLEEKNQQYYNVFRLCIWLGVIVIACIFIFSFIVLGNVLRNMNYLLNYLDEIAGGNFKADCPVKTNDEIGVIAGHTRKMAGKIEWLLKQAAESEKLKQQSQYQLLQARYNTLQSQVNPHFLYNMLQSINGIAQLHGDTTVSELICRLASFFRSNLDRTYRFCHLKDELEYIDNYLTLYQAIYGDRLNVVYHIEEGLEKCSILTYVMQPIIENSLVHGMENKIGTCTIEIVVKAQSGTLIIQINDDGEGIPPERLDTLLDMNAPDKAEKRIGLRNVHERIQLLYGSQYGLSIESEYKKGTSVIIRLPLEPVNIL